MTAIPELLRADQVGTWDDTADVIVIGYGIAGACAALEARRAGADVLVIERASGGGGSSALATGIFYLGGGTPVQQACGYADSPEDMYKFLMASTRAPDPAVVRRFCDESVEHFGWLEAQGVPFSRTAYEEKGVLNRTPDCLCSTGNEKQWPYREVAAPVPRGHKVSMPGDGAGKYATDALIGRCAEVGVRVRCDSRVTALVADAAGRIVGVRIREAGRSSDLGARRAVVIAAGGFSMNGEMLRSYVPQLPPTAEPLGTPQNDGDAILLGQSAGGTLQAMNGIVATGSFYPPAQLVKGVLVNLRGERFIAEDSYHGRTADFVMDQPDSAAYLIVDSEIFAYPEIARARHRLVDGWDTITDMEAGLGLPEGSLRRTMETYNRDAAAGHDTLFNKHPDSLKPLDRGPYAAFDVSYANSLYMFLTLGGLRATAEAEVLDRRGRPVPGLYAAGACVSSIPQDGKGYASGLSLGPGSYYGRVAGRNAARAAVNG